MCAVWTSLSKNKKRKIAEKGFSVFLYARARMCVCMHVIRGCALALLYLMAAGVKTAKRGNAFYARKWQIFPKNKKIKKIFKKLFQMLDTY